MQPQVFRIVRLAEHRDGQFLGLPTALRSRWRRASISPVGRSALVVPVGPLAHLAVDADHPLGAHRFGRLEGGAVGIGHHLRDAVVVAQVDEQHAAVVAHAMHPARQARGFADIGFAQGAAGVRAVTVQFGLGHGALVSIEDGRELSRKSAWAAAKVKAAAGAAGAEEEPLKREPRRRVYTAGRGDLARLRERNPWRSD